MTDTLDQPRLDVRVKREPLIYEPASPHSFFADLCRVADGIHPDAERRLERHQVQMNVELRGGQLHEDIEGVQFEHRIVDSAVGLGGEFDPPLWMIPLFASGARAGRVVADLIDQAGNLFVLPPGVSSVNIPRITPGSTTATQYDTVPEADTDMGTANASSPVVTLAGEQMVSQQLYDLTPAPGFDKIAATDLQRAYDRNLDAQLTAGNGPSTQGGAQLTGLANVSGVPANNHVSGAGVGLTTTSVNTLTVLTGQAAANIGTNRNLPPEAMVMAPRRWFWVAAGVDSQNRPLASPGGGVYHSETSIPAIGGTKSFGPLNTLPVYVTGSIAGGSGTDVVYLCRPNDFYLWESTPKFIAAPNPGSGTLQIRLSLHRYVAAVLGRYPTGIGSVTAIPAPTGFQG